MTVDKESLKIIQECVQGSQEDNLDFITAVKKLSQAGVESYHVDYRHQDMTYYLSSDETYAAKMGISDLSIADKFSSQEIEKSVHAIQNGEIIYTEFKKRTMAAGCIGYMVWIKGQRVQYFGRRGEMHIEDFSS